MYKQVNCRECNKELLRLRISRFSICDICKNRRVGKNYRANPEKKHILKAAAKRYYEKNKKKILFNSKEKYLENKEKIIQRVKKYRELNREKISKRKKENYLKNKDKIVEQNRLSYLRRKEKIKEYSKKYRKKNAEKILLKNRNRKNKIRSLSKNSDIDNNYLIYILKENRFCLLCGIEMIKKMAPNQKTIDHIKPLNIGGEHIKTNIRVICRNCNEKRPKDGRDIKG